MKKTDKTIERVERERERESKTLEKQALILMQKIQK